MADCGFLWASTVNCRVLYLYRQLLSVLCGMASIRAAGIGSFLGRPCNAVDLKEDMDWGASERAPFHSRYLFRKPVVCCCFAFRAETAYETCKKSSQP